MILYILFALVVQLYLFLRELILWNILCDLCIDAMEF